VAAIGFTYEAINEESVVGVPRKKICGEKVDIRRNRLYLFAKGLNYPDVGRCRRN
jgi:hypothetical protein